LLKASLRAQKVHVEIRVLLVHHVAHEILSYDKELREGREFLCSDRHWKPPPPRKLVMLEHKDISLGRSEFKVILYQLSRFLGVVEVELFLIVTQLTLLELFEA